MIRGRRRIQTGLSEHKTLALYREGQRLLAEKDYEAISVADLSKAADLSVGAFYVRFKDKELFLSFIATHTFGQARRRFDNMVGEIASAKQPGEALTDYLISEFANREFGGVVRVALKLGFVDVLHRTPLDAFRRHVAEAFVETTEAKAADMKDVTRKTVIQSVFGVLVDAVTSFVPDAPPDWQKIRPVLIGMLNQSKKRVNLKTKPSPEDTREKPQSKPSKI